VSCLKKQY